MKGLPSEYVAEADREDDCAMLVNKHYPKALGATWIGRSEDKFAKGCWAEFGDELVSSSSSRTCSFKGI